jgi:hypothetical protein
MKKNKLPIIRISKFSQYIGCSQEQLVSHLEAQFKPGMTWENYTLYGWHIDHIIPLSSAKDDKELYSLLDNDIVKIYELTEEEIFLELL